MNEERFAESSQHEFTCAPASVAAAWLRPMLCCVTPSWARCRYTWVSCSPQNPPNTVNTARNLAAKVVKNVV